MGSLSILYLTEPNIDPFVRDVCIKHLHRAVGDLPLVSASQGPCTVGKNVDLGVIGRSGLNMYKQILAGLDLIDTKYVAIAEHDCIYSPEHFTFVPPNDEYYWYNTNCWLMQYKNPAHPEYDGMFSLLKKRKVQSQLICDVERLREVTKFQIGIVSTPEWNKVRNNMPIGEPGTLLYDRAMKITQKVKSIRSVVKDFLNSSQARSFSTDVPNIDIRHGNNFTGQRRGNFRRFELKPWGTMADVMSI